MAVAVAASDMTAATLCLPPLSASRGVSLSLFSLPETETEKEREETEGALDVAPRCMGDGEW